MCGKFIILTVFMTIMVCQLNATKCFTCNSPSSCRNPETLTCDQKAANLTHTILAKYFENFPTVTNDTSIFECVQISYILDNSTAIDINGCINADIDPCELRFLITSYTRSICRKCKTDLCNPAGTYSSSTAVMLSTVFNLLLWLFLGIIILLF